MAIKITLVDVDDSEVYFANTTLVTLVGGATKAASDLAEDDQIVLALAGEVKVATVEEIE